MSDNAQRDVDEAVRRLRQSVDAKKCWRCGCFHNALTTIEQAIPSDQQSALLHEALSAGRDRLVEQQYECLGCEPCYPPLAMNALDIGDDACPVDEATPREGWPPLPGAYRVLRYGAPVAVCTLTDEELSDRVAELNEPSIGIVGSTQTENLGIERIITNIVANPTIRFLLLCGEDSQQRIGHLPGQSLLALAANGLDDRKRIIGAKGRRPYLMNIDPGAIAYFRLHITIIDRIGTRNPLAIAAAAEACRQEYPGPGPGYDMTTAVPTVEGSLPDRMISDKAGYFIIYSDAAKRRLVLEHYRTDGVLDLLITGHSAAELYMTAIERKLVSRLDHAAYLGKELSRAEHCLATGEGYVQDAAPEQPAPACSDKHCACADGATPGPPSCA